MVSFFLVTYLHCSDLFFIFRKANDETSEKWKGPEKRGILVTHGELRIRMRLNFLVKKIFKLKKKDLQLARKVYYLIRRLEDF